MTLADLSDITIVSQLTAGMSGSLFPPRQPSVLGQLGAHRRVRHVHLLQHKRGSYKRDAQNGQASDEHLSIAQANSQRRNFVLAIEDQAAQNVNGDAAAAGGHARPAPELSTFA
jgi:hypothetical protein